MLETHGSERENIWESIHVRRERLMLASPMDAFPNSCEMHAECSLPEILALLCNAPG
jgi:hypothetical protein